MMLLSLRSSCREADLQQQCNLSVMGRTDRSRRHHITAQSEHMDLLGLRHMDLLGQRHMDHMGQEHHMDHEGRHMELVLERRRDSRERHMGTLEQHMGYEGRHSLVMELEHRKGHAWWHLGSSFVIQAPSLSTASLVSGSEAQ